MEAAIDGLTCEVAPRLVGEAARHADHRRQREVERTTDVHAEGFFSIVSIANVEQDLRLLPHIELGAHREPTHEWNAGRAHAAADVAREPARSNPSIRSDKPRIVTHEDVDVV